MKIILFFLSFFMCLNTSFAQFGGVPGLEMQDDFNVGGDIFSDFNEDLEASQVMEDERFYRYGRFFGVNMGVGITTFSGNRGLAYSDEHPTLHFSVMYFFDFQSALTLGFEYSKHYMTVDTYTAGSGDDTYGLIDIAMLRPFIGYRYYVDTADLGTAITYSNPYFVGRFEYWYQTNKFRERTTISDQSGGGIGVGLGFGLEFPIELKKSYFNVEFLWHNVSFFDKYTDDYRQYPDGHVPGDTTKLSEYGFDDLTGYVYSLMMSYNISW